MNQNWLRTFPLQTSLLLLAFLIQYQLVFPLESLIIDPKESLIVSYAFLPHGVKSILIVLLGPAALIPVFVSQLISDLVLGHTGSYALISSMESTLALAIPLVLLNQLSANKSFAALRLDVDYSFSLVRVVMFVAIIQGFANSLIRSIIHSDQGLSLLSLRYLSGDIGGTIILLGLVIAFRKPIVSFVQKRLY